MAFRVGDKVKFLNDTGGGTITKFLDPQKVLVRIEDDFEVPYMISELIMDQGEDVSGRMNRVWKSEQNGDMVEKTSRTKEKILKPDTNGLGTAKRTGQVYLAFVQEGNPYLVHLYLINDTNYQVYYVIGLRRMNILLYKHSGFLEADTKVLLEKYHIDDPDIALAFHIQIIGYKEGYYEPMMPVDQVIEINTKKLVEGEYQAENEYFDEPSAIFKITTTGKRDNDLILDTKITDKMAIREKEENTKIGRGKKIKAAVPEIDLHSHVLIEDESSLSNGEILEIQLKKFEEALEEAFRKNIRKIVFIHGIGDGRLKFDIRRTLDDKYPDLKYQDASFKEYGYGATMVILK